MPSIDFLPTRLNSRRVYAPQGASRVEVSKGGAPDSINRPKWYGDAQGFLTKKADYRQIKPTWVNHKYSDAVRLLQRSVEQQPALNGPDIEKTRIDLIDRIEHLNAQHAAFYREPPVLRPSVNVTRPKRGAWLPKLLQAGIKKNRGSQRLLAQAIVQKRAAAPAEQIRNARAAATPNFSQETQRLLARLPVQKETPMTVQQLKKRPNSHRDESFGLTCNVRPLGTQPSFSQETQRLPAQARVQKETQQASQQLKKRPLGPQSRENVRPLSGVKNRSRLIRGVSNASVMKHISGADPANDIPDFNRLGLYYERQRGLRCGEHALNMGVGKRLIEDIEAELADIGNKSKLPQLGLTNKIVEGHNLALSEGETPDGQTSSAFDLKVMADARGLDTEIFYPTATDNSFQRRSQGKFERAQSLLLMRAGHWVTLRPGNDQQWRQLDSTNSRAANKGYANAREAYDAFVKEKGTPDNVVAIY